MTNKSEMSLAKVFEDIAFATSQEQALERQVAKSREHALPLIAVLNKIKNVLLDPDKIEVIGHFRVVEGSTRAGSLVLSVGLKKFGYSDDDNVDANWMTKTGSAERFVKFFVEPDGKASAVRWDRPVADRNFPGGFSPVNLPCNKVADLMPILASWVEDNVREAIPALMPKKPEPRSCTAWG